LEVAVSVQGTKKTMGVSVHDAKIVVKKLLQARIWEGRGEERKSGASLNLDRQKREMRELGMEIRGKKPTKSSLQVQRDVIGKGRSGPTASFCSLEPQINTRNQGVKRKSQKGRETAQLREKKYKAGQVPGAVLPGRNWRGGGRRDP